MMAPYTDRTKGTQVGALVTLDLPDDSPVLSLPWIITFGPVSDDEEWEPVVCGPYERAHAIALAETVVADEELMAVVEPVLPHATVEEIRSEIETNRAAAAEDEEDFDADFDEQLDSASGGEDIQGSLDDAYEEGEELAEEEAAEMEEVEPTPPPSPDEIRAGFARIAARLTSASA